MRFRTTRGYDFGEVSSAMQKAIRRGDAKLAGYWALELFHSGYANYVWKRLLTISAEDCWGILTQEIKALHDGYQHVNRGLPVREHKGRIFISKAVILLCLAKKSRDADHLQNLVYDQLRGIDPEALTAALREAPEYQPSRVGGADGLRGTRPMTVLLRPSSNRTGGFPASGFPGLFTRGLSVCAPFGALRELMEAIAGGEFGRVMRTP